MYRMCVFILTDLMGYPALWPTLINEVGPKRRKSKARKIVVKIWRVLENMIVICLVKKSVATNVVVVHGDVRLQ